MSAEAKHASYLYYGTKRHFIKPIKAKVLSWSEGGKRFFSRGHFVSGVYAGRKSTGRTKGTRSTPKNSTKLRWFERAWNKRRTKTLNKVSKGITKIFGF